MTTIKVRNLNIPRLPIRWKVKGADAMKISEKIKKVEHLKQLIPNDVHVEITRNYGNGCG
jgi:hypothetical protein